VASQTPEQLKAAHERLARALEGSIHEAPHVLAELWRGAGDPERGGAEQLLRVGEFDAGIAAVRQLLQRVKLSWPPTPLVTVLTFLLLRTWRVLRGYKSPRCRALARAARVRRCAWTCAGRSRAAWGCATTFAPQAFSSAT
jgi:hypothetical protein